MTVANFEKSLDPIDAEISGSFQRKIRPLRDSPTELLNEFRRFQPLLSRPAIHKALTREREALLGQLVDLLDATGDGLETLVQSAILSVPCFLALVQNLMYMQVENRDEIFSWHVSEHVSGILIAKQIASRVHNITDGVPGLFEDLCDGKRLQLLGHEILTRCRKTEHDLLRHWVVEVEEALSSKDSGMRM